MNNAKRKHSIQISHCAVDLILQEWTNYYWLLLIGYASAIIMTEVEYFWTGKKSGFFEYVVFWEQLSVCTGC